MNLPAGLGILLIDDNPDDRALVAHALKSEFADLSVEQITDAETFERALVRSPFDLAITDFALRWTDGLAVLKAIRDQGIEVPVIMFTGTGTEEVAVEAMKAGFSDYIVKTPKQFARLPFAVRSALERQHEQVVLKAMEDRLRHTQKLEALGQLAAGIAHDFNNLLTALQGYAGLLLDDLPADSQSHRDAEMILKTTERAIDLTRQLVRFSRKEVAATSPIDLCALVEAFVPMLSRTIGEQVSITLLGERGVVICADRGQVEQVLLNLAVNARDAMPPGGGELEVSVSMVDEWPPDVDAPVRGDGPLARLSVRDDGHGMDEETRRRAFEPFFTTKQEGHGTGLGLASVYGIVTGACGGVRIVSAPGAGTTVELFWPVVTGEEPSETDPEGLAGHEP